MWDTHRDRLKLYVDELVRVWMTSQKTNPGAMKCLRWDLFFAPFVKRGLHSEAN